MNEEHLECGHALCLREREIKRERMRTLSVGVLYACKSAYTLFSSQREREKERVFIVKRNDGCLGTF